MYHSLGWFGARRPQLCNMITSFGWVQEQLPALLLLVGNSYLTQPHLLPARTIPPQEEVVGAMSRFVNPCTNHGTRVMGSFASVDVCQLLSESVL